MKKRIAIIIERADAGLGGAERSVFELADALSGRNLQADILAAKGQTSATNVRILCKETPGKRTCYFGFAKVLKKHLSENSYDIIHSVLPFEFADVYQPRGGCFAESIFRNAASYQNKFLESYKRMTAFGNFRRTILLQAERKLCKKEDGPVIAALSQYVAEQFKRHYNVDDDRVTVIANGVQINKQIDTAEARRFRSGILTRLNLKETDNPALFLFVANNFRLKGLVPLIRAMRLAISRFSADRAYLIVAGRDKINKYHHTAKNLNVREKIVFSGPIQELQNAFSVIDVAILPTFYDPSSRYILEALASAKPVITTRFNGAADLFVNDRHGKVIDSPENIGALAEAISYFTEHDNIQKASEAIIDDNLKEKISISRVAEQLESLYESIFEKRRGQ